MNTLFPLLTSFFFAVGLSGQSPIPNVSIFYAPNSGFSIQDGTELNGALYTTVLPGFQPEFVQQYNRNAPQVIPIQEQENGGSVFLKYNLNSGAVDWAFYTGLNLLRVEALDDNAIALAGSTFNGGQYSVYDSNGINALNFEIELTEATSLGDEQHEFDGLARGPDVESLLAVSGGYRGNYDWEPERSETYLIQDFLKETLEDIVMDSAATVPDLNQLFTGFTVGLSNPRTTPRAEWAFQVVPLSDDAQGFPAADMPSLARNQAGDVFGTYTASAFGNLEAIYGINNIRFPESTTTFTRFTQGNQGVYALNADGTFRWQIGWGEPIPFGDNGTPRVVTAPDPENPNIVNLYVSGVTEGGNLEAIFGDTLFAPRTIYFAKLDQEDGSVEFVTRIEAAGVISQEDVEASPDGRSFFFGGIASGKVFVSEDGTAEVRANGTPDGVGLWYDIESNRVSWQESYHYFGDASEVPERGQEFITEVEVTDGNRLVHAGTFDRDLNVPGLDTPYINPDSNVFTPSVFVADYELNGTTNTEEIAGTFPFTLFPNPAHDQLLIQWEIGLVRIPYRITDLMGRLIQEGTWQTGEAINIGNFPTGTYWLHLRQGKVMYSRPFVKR